FGNTRCGYRNPFRSHVKSVWGSNPLNGSQYVGIVKQWLPHPHVHNVAERLAVVFLCLPGNEHDLVVDFVGMQISLAVHIAGCTKLTAKTAANLGAHAGGHSVGCRDEYALYNVSIG